QLFARECGLNPKQVIDRVETLAKSVISEAEAAQSEVAAMPAGGHAILDQARRAVERRARTLLSQLQEFRRRSSRRIHWARRGSRGGDLKSRARTYRRD